MTNSQNRAAAAQAALAEAIRKHRERAEPHVIVTDPHAPEPPAPTPTEKEPVKT